MISAATDNGQVQAPSALLALTELPRAIAELVSLPLAAPMLATAPRGDGHPVIVLPGFVTSDYATSVLRAYLKALGHDARTWDLGRNLGPKAIGLQGERLVERVKAVHEQTGRTVSLVGWSLGGVMARLVARRHPEMVRQIITLGSPFIGSPKASNVWRTYEMLTRHRVDDRHARSQMGEVSAALTVPSTAIFSKSDGVVAWQNCREPRGTVSDNIEVWGSHCGLVFNASVLYAVADRLAMPEKDWAPFDHHGYCSALYPPAGVA